MSAGASLNYDFDTKNHWRRTVWNALLRRLNRRHKREIVIYLAGVEDLDRTVALEKGVPWHNLIAVEKDKTAFDRLRAAGVPVIRGDLLDVLREWPDNKPVCAIHADYCCGLEFENINLYNMLERPALRRAVMCVNLQRGRDPWSNDIRTIIDKSGAQQFATESKHRGWQFLAYHAVDTLSSFYTGATIKDDSNFVDKAKDAKPRVMAINPQSGQFVHDLVMQGMRAQFLSYLSSKGNKMDTAVFEHPIRMLLDDGLHCEEAWQAEMAEANCPKDVDLRRRISAQLAWRTMRINRASAS